MTCASTLQQVQETQQSAEDLPGSWGDQLHVGQQGFSWLWDGYLACGNFTLLTSQWKSGKTTLISVLLSRLKQGGNLAGMTVHPARACVISEESRQQWHLRHQKLDLAHVYFICRPFKGKPEHHDWLALLDKVAALALHHGIKLLIIDTLASFLPARTESLAAPLMQSLFPLQRLTALGLAVLLLHHPRKGEPLPGQAARGSGALPAFVDVILEMSCCPHAPADDRRRRILAFSRHDCTPSQCVVELNLDGNDYLSHGDFQDDDFAANWKVLRMVLEDAPDKRSRKQLLEDWPADFTRPQELTLWRWLQRAINLGLVLQEGSGRKNDPFRFWLPNQEAIWKQNPLWELYRSIEESNRQVNAALRKQGHANI